MMAGGVRFLILVVRPDQGKTSLVRRLRDRGFREEYVKTLGFDIAVVPFGTYQVHSSTAVYRYQRQRLMDIVVPSVYVLCMI